MYVYIYEYYFEKNNLFKVELIAHLYLLILLFLLSCLQDKIA